MRPRPSRRVLPFFVLAMIAGFAAAPGLARAASGLPAVDAALQDFRAGTGTADVSLRLATVDGEVYRRHAGAYDDATRLPIASASKWLSALVLGRLVERGVLRWDSTVGEWFPEAPPATHAITLAQLYSHTSGIGIDDAACLSDRGTTLQACALAILAEPLAWAPGTAFAYGGNSMQVGGAMAERATGRSWDALFLAEVVQPLGLQATDWSAFSGLPGYVPNPNPRVAGGARSTLSDYGRVVDMALAGGGDYLRTDTIAAMAADRTVGTVVEATPVEGLGYGIGQWIETKDAFGASTRVSSPGAFGFTPWVDWHNPSNGVVAVFGSGPALREPLFALEAACLDALDEDAWLQRHAPAASPPVRAVPVAGPRAAVPRPAPSRHASPSRLDARRPAH